MVYDDWECKSDFLQSTIPYPVGLCQPALFNTGFGSGNLKCSKQNCTYYLSGKCNCDPYDFNNTRALNFTFPINYNCSHGYDASMTFWSNFIAVVSGLTTFECELGTYPTNVNGNKSCSPCPVDTYLIALGEPSCEPCPYGTTTSGKTGQWTCSGSLGCPPGSYNSSGGYCYPCPSDTYSNVFGLNNCTTCPAGKTTGGSMGKTNCSDFVDCPAGGYLWNGNCLPCAPETFSDTNNSLSCKPCPQGSTTNGNNGQSMCFFTCNSSQAVSEYGTAVHKVYGSTCGSNLTTTDILPVGVCTPWLDGTGSAVFLCDSAQWSYYRWATCNCTGPYIIDGGKTGVCWSDGSDRTEAVYCNVTKQPTLCLPGQYLFGTCHNCPVNTFSTGINKPSCDACPAGTGTNDTSGQSACSVACPAGNFLSPQNGNPCNPCPSNTFSNKTNSLECYPCANGTYTGGMNGQSVCFKPPSDCSTYDYTKLPLLPSSGIIFNGTCQNGTKKFNQSYVLDICTKTSNGQPGSQRIKCYPNNTYNFITYATCDCTGVITQNSWGQANTCAKNSSISSPQIICDVQYPGGDVCAAGYYVTVNRTCSQCSKNTYSAVPNSPKCQSCPAGTEASAPGMTACTTVQGTPPPTPSPSPTVNCGPYIVQDPSIQQFGGSASCTSSKNPPGTICTYQCAKYYTGNLSAICKDGIWTVISRPQALPCAPGNWSDFSTCTVKTCGGGNQTRYRNISGPSSCGSIEIQTIPCNTQLCPVDCIPEDWSNWTACAPYCGQGTHSRTRGIKQPAQNGGASDGCTPLYQKRDCTNTLACPITYAPLIKSIYLKSSGTSLECTFDQPTNRSNCSFILNAVSLDKLGLTVLTVALKCYWREANILVFNFGDNPTILPGDTLSVSNVWDVTGTRALEGLRDAVPVYPPLTFDNPLTAFIKPEIYEISQCGLLQLYGANSGPGAGRPLKFYRWTQLSYTPDGSPLFLSNSSTLIVNASALIVDATYDFQLAVGNWFGETAFLTRSIRVKSENFARLSLPYSSWTSYRPIEWRIRGQIDILPASCGVPLNAQLYTFLWKQTRGPLIDGIVKTSAELYIPPRKFQPGLDYEFFCFATLFGQTSNSSIVVSIAPSPIKAISSGGEREFNIDEDYILNASLSYDPDLENNTGVGLVYLWDCRNINGTACLSPSLTTVNQTTPLLTVKPTDWNLTAADLIITISLTIFKGNLSDITYMKLYPVKKAVPVVILDTISDVLAFPSSKELILSGHVEPKSSTVKYTWVGSDNIILNSDILTTGINAEVLGFKAGVFSGGQAITLTLVATIGSVSGNASITIFMASPPSGGRCYNASMGKAYSEPFTLTCESWTTAYPDLTYAWILTNKNQTLKGEGSLSTITPFLPAGDLTILVIIKDAKGSTTQYLFNFTVAEFNVTDAGGVASVGHTVVTTTLAAAIAAVDLDGLGQSVALVSVLFSSTTITTTNGTATKPDAETVGPILTSLLAGVATIADNIPPSTASSIRIMQTISTVTSDPTQLTTSIRSTSLTLIQTQANNALTLSKQNGDSQLGQSIASSIVTSVVSIGTSITYSSKQTSANQTQVQEETLAYATVFVQTMSTSTSALLSGALPGLVRAITSGNTTVTAGRQDISAWAETIMSNPIGSVGIDPAVFGGLAGVLDGSLISTPDIYASVGNGVETTVTRTSVMLSISFQNSDGASLEVNNSQATQQLPDLNSLACAPQNKTGLISFTFNHEPIQNNKKRKCTYWARKEKQYKGEGCVADCGNASTKTKTLCWCTHLTEFTIQFDDFVPRVNTISEKDVTALTPENVAAHPATLIAVMVWVGLFLILLPFAIRKDRRDEDENLRQAKIEKWETTEYNPTYWASLKNSLRQQPAWWSPFTRKFGDRFTSMERLVTLFAAFFVTSAVSAIFYGKQPMGAQLIVAVLSSVPAFGSTFILTFLFSHAKEDNIRTNLHKKKKQEISMKKSTLLGRLLDDDLGGAGQIPTYFRTVAFVIAFILCLGSAFLMIIYGVRFDTMREGLETSATWSMHENVQLSGQIIRESQDNLDTCQKHCLNQRGCTGIVNRTSDYTCFEMNGPLSNITDPNYIAYTFTDLRTPVSTKWVISLTAGVIFQMIMDGIKIVLIVSLVWYCYGRYRLQRTPSVASRPLPEGVELEAAETNDRPHIESPSGTPATTARHAREGGEIGETTESAPGLELDDSSHDDVDVL